MEPAEVRRRATRGAAVLGLRTLTIRGLTFASSVVLARLLSPRDFGIIAFGASLVTLAGLLADGGIGIGLIRGVREPDELDLGTMLGLQLGGSVLLAVLVSGIALRFGEPGRITAVLSLSIPLSALSTPGSIIMERQLAYGTLALVETLGVLTYAGWSVVSVVLGAGVWGLATAMVLGPAVQSVATLAAVPRGRVRPRLVRSRARQLLAFGVRFQGAGLADMARDQGINIGTASIVGVGTLGVWSLVTRLLQAPFSLLEVTGRVAYPMMARLLAAGEDPADELERMMAVIGLCVGLLIAGLVGTGPVFTVVAFGAKWESAVAALPWVGFAFVLNSPVAVVLGGYLYARGEAGAGPREVKRGRERARERVLLGGRCGAVRDVGGPRIVGRALVV